jgi:hypothetical protein
MKKIILLATAAALPSGCSTVVNGTTQSVVIDTAPQGAICSVKRIEEGVIGVVNPTPGTLLI